MGFEFHETKMGHQFYLGTMPEVAKNLKMLSMELEKANSQRKQYAKLTEGERYDVVEQINQEISNGAKVEHIQELGRASNSVSLLVIYSAPKTND